eukprot:761262-Hanusia_phi.AAC.2
MRKRSLSMTLRAWQMFDSDSNVKILFIECADERRGKSQRLLFAAAFPAVDEGDPDEEDAAEEEES